MRANANKFGILICGQLISCLYMPSMLDGGIKTGLISLCNTGYRNPCVVCAFSVPRNETKLL